MDEVVSLEEQWLSRAQGFVTMLLVVTTDGWRVQHADASVGVAKLRWSPWTPV